MATERNEDLHEQPHQRALDHEEESGSKPTPLPKLQLFITLLVQFTEPATAFVIYPFINQLIRDTGINGGDEAKTGYVAGVIESSFFVAECLTVVQWGYLSDRIGRRPVLLIGPLGLAVCTALFGLSSTFWRLLVLRCLQGAFNGNIGIAKSVIAEITDETNVGEAYGYNPLMWSAGSTIASFLGGVLSKPAERWPSLFGHSKLFTTYPYFLPCAVAGGIAFGTFLIAFLGLKESLPSIVAQNKARKTRSASNEAADATTPLLHKPTDNSYGARSDGAPLAESQPETVTPVPQEWEDRVSNAPSLFYRPLMLVYVNYVFLTFCDMCNSVLLPLMYSTPIEYGGLGLEPIHIGTATGTFGLVNSLFQSQVFGSVVRRYSARRVYQIGYSALTISFLMYPILKFFAQRAGHVDAAVVVCIVLQYCAIGMIYMAYGTIQVLLVQSVPEGAPMGAANGIGQMVSSAMRTIAPVVASSLFSVSLQRNLLGGNLGFYLLLGLSCIGARASLLLIEPSTLKNKNRERSPSNSIN